MYSSGCGNSRCTVDERMEEKCDCYDTETYISLMNHVIVLKVSAQVWSPSLPPRLGSLSADDGPRQFRE